MKNFLKFRKTRYPSVPAWDIRRFQEVFVRYRGVLREAEEDGICFLILPLGIQNICPAIQIKFL